jgi:hypothetical protein
MDNQRHVDRRSFRFGRDDSEHQLLLDLAFEILYRARRLSVASDLLTRSCPQIRMHIYSFNKRSLTVLYRHRILCFLTTLPLLVRSYMSLAFFWNDLMRLLHSSTASSIRL